MKINPDSIHIMMKDYISDIYLYEKESLKKLKGYYITAIDGSDIVLPSSKENELIYGKNAHAKINIQPVAGKVSMIYDCLNKLILDTRIGKFRHNEIELAELHLKEVSEVLNKDNRTIVIFDRNYFSFASVTKMIDNKQKFINHKIIQKDIKALYRTHENW